MINSVQDQKKIRKKEILIKVYAPYWGWELPLNSFKSGIFRIKTTLGEGLKILTLKQMLQRLLIALAQVKAGNTSENLLNEIRQIMYSLYRAKENAKTVYNNIMNWIKL